MLRMFRTRMTGKLKANKIRQRDDAGETCVGSWLRGQPNVDHCTFAPSDCLQHRSEVGWLWVQGLIQPLEGNPNHGHSEYKAVIKLCFLKCFCMSAHLCIDQQAFLQHHSFAVPPRT